MSAYPSGCLGKLPLHGDFIRFNAASPEVHELHHWVQEGIYHGYQDLGQRWDGAFDTAPSARFIYTSPRNHRVVAGLFRPSVDKAGRRYPFLVYTMLDAAALGADLGYLPFALEPFLAKATEVAMWADSAINLNTFLTAFDSLRFEPDLAEARRAFARFVLGKTAGGLWASLFGAECDARRVAAVQAVADGPEQRQGTALRLPLNEPVAEAAFWTELTRRLNRAKSMPTMVMWNERGGETPARLHLAFGELSPRCFLPFVLPTRADTGLRDFSAPAAAGKGGAFDAVLNETSLKLSDLLQRLPRCKGI